MENPNSNNAPESPKLKRNMRGRSLGGLILIVVGLIILSKRAGSDIPHWLFDWPMVLVVVAIFIGSRRNFQLGPWLILLLVGILFLVEGEFFDFNIHEYFWPALLIFIGLVMMFKPRMRTLDKTKNKASNPDSIDSFALLGSCKKSILSKNFQGGRIETIFGSTEVSFMQADINGIAGLNFYIIFGGAKIFVPQNWNIKTDISATFGSVEDKRNVSSTIATSKTLILNGMVIFGSVVIKSY